MSAVASLVSAKPAAWQDTPPIVKLLIGDEFVGSQSKEWRDIVNPVTQEVLARVSFTTAGEVDATIRSAHAAFATQKNMPVGARTCIILRFRALIREHSPRIAHTLAAEQGKTLPDAEGDTFCGLEVAERAYSVDSLQQGEFLENMAGAVDTYMLRQPIGACAGTTPFNFPAMTPLWMLPMAIVCDNVFVLKPSKQDPLSTMQLVESALEVGVSPGVLNVVCGGKDVVDALCMHEHTKAIPFVDSTAVGAHVYRLGNEHGKCVQSMMDTKSHAVMLPDTNREQAINVLVGAAFDTVGQRCMATSVVVLVGTTQQWVSDLITRAKTLRVNAGVESGIDVGPVVLRAAERRILSLIKSGVQQGATLALDGRSVCVAGYEDGNFIGLTIFADVEADMDICTNEIFGPTLLALTVSTLDDAIALVNTNPFGNGMSLFTQGGTSVRKFQSEIDVGQAGINTPIPVPAPHFSFTDSCGSKLGDLGSYGKQVVQFYTQTKTVTVRWFDDAVDTGGVNTTIGLH